MSFTRSQRGFTMALALALAVVMGLMLMKVAPNVIMEVQRENEEELIFRGEAIANALRVFATKNGRYPIKLEEIMKVRPRILRQDYLDPMTPEGEWELITQVQPGASGNKEGLPIIGVRSKSFLNSIHIYQGRTLIHDWQFSAEQNVLGVTDGIKKLQQGVGGSLPAAGTAPEKPAPKE